MAMKILVEQVLVKKGISKESGNTYFTFEVVEPVMKFIGFENNQQKGILEDLADSGQPVDLNLTLKGNRLQFDSFN